MQESKTTKEIKPYLVNRYLNGYTFIDTQYSNLIEKLVSKAKEINNGISLIDRLYAEIGEYTTITEQIYMDVARKYLHKFKYHYKKGQHYGIYSTLSVQGQHNSRNIEYNKSNNIGDEGNSTSLRNNL